VRIYLSHVLFSVLPTNQTPHSLEPLVAEIITHLSCILPSDPIFTAIMWPAFIAGAETNDRANQEWVVKKFRELWEVEPWGLIRGALGVLEKIWAGKRSGELGNGEGTLPTREKGDRDWIGDLRDIGVDWLIL
jgi:hypothetical protein